MIFAVYDIYNKVFPTFYYINKFISIIIKSNESLGQKSFKSKFGKKSNEKIYSLIAQLRSVYY